MRLKNSEIEKMRINLLDTNNITHTFQLSRKMQEETLLWKNIDKY